MANYTHEYSTFPEKIDELVGYKDVDDSIGTLINQINALRDSEDYEGAQMLIAKYSDELKPYNLSMQGINKVIESIRNTQIKSKTAGQFLSISSEIPTEVDNGFVWIGGE